MIKARDMVKGTIIEIITPGIGLTLGAGGNFHEINQAPQMYTGEQYELVSDVKKHKTYFIAVLKQINGTKNGNAFWSFLEPHIKIVSQPTVEPPTHTDNELKLAKNEELVFVKKDQKNLFMVRPTHSYAVPKGSDEIFDGSFVFSKKIGQRKKIKNIHALYGFLHNNTGLLNKEYFKNYYVQQPHLEEEHRYHLHALSNMPGWINNLGFNPNMGFSDIESLKNIELHKYNLDTKKVSEQAIDFDSFNYVREFINSVHITRLFGEGVSSVINDLNKEKKLDDYPYILSIKHDILKYEYSIFIPKEKDIYFEKTVKELDLNKKDLFFYNKNGFVAIAFQDNNSLNLFKNGYKNKEKIMFEYRTDNIINHPELDHELFVSKKKKFKL